MATKASDEAIATPPRCGGYAILRRAMPASLARCVTGITCYHETATGHFRQYEPASLVVPLIIGFEGPFAIGVGRPPGPSDALRSFAAGLWPGNVVIDSFGTAHCLQINFTPLGAYRFFGLPMHELSARLVEPGDLLGPDFTRLRDRLGEEEDWDRRIDLAQAFVVKRLRESSHIASPHVAWAFEALLATDGNARIRWLAERLDWSRKHLAHRFAVEVGAGPKTVARIARFNRALALGRQHPAPGWAGIAAECGYADQAHLVREFRDFAGCSPTEIGALLF